MLDEGFLNAPVSVVIPCYCCAETIERAVQSVASQTSRPAEIILVEDGSGDKTLLILYELHKKYGDWIRVIESPWNVGAASARNTGWRLATQPYIAFLDSDDAWHSRKIEIQYGYMESNPNVVLSGHLYRELIPNSVDDLNWLVELKSITKVTWKRLLLKNQFVTPSVMVNRNIPFRFTEGKYYMEDHLLWLEIVCANMITVKLNIDLVAIYKPMYGASGLSSNLWLMEKAELSNYQYYYNKGKLSPSMYVFIQCFSLAKYLRRLLVVYLVRPFLTLVS